MPRKRKNRPMVTNPSAVAIAPRTVLNQPLDCIQLAGGVAVIAVESIDVAAQQMQRHARGKSAQARLRAPPSPRDILPVASWLLIFKRRNGSFHPSLPISVVDQSQALVVASGSKQLLRFVPVRGDRPCPNRRARPKKRANCQCEADAASTSAIPAADRFTSVGTQHVALPYSNSQR